MNNYTQRLLLTIWRKKSTILIAIFLITIIIYGLQYTNRSENKNGVGKNSVLFFESNDKQQVHLSNSNYEPSDSNKVGKLEQPLHDEISAKRRAEDDESNLNREMEQQLGIPYVNLDTKNPYIPKKRIVHFDLKGAPPKITYLKKVMPLLKNLGATGLLIEYEDMFPYTGILKDLRAKNAYTKDDVKEILGLAYELKLQVIPLIQTFGHVEFALKHKHFLNIREVPNSPQALCPSKNISLDFLSEMIRQVLELHPKSHYLHIGCDEVFQMGECELCRLELHDTLFLRHVQNVVSLVHERRPGMHCIIWDDMLRHLSTQTMLDMQLGSLVEPMVWVYAEDIYRFVQPQVWEKYSTVFQTAWAASAFKGAFGEQIYIAHTRRHLENHLRWLDVMSQQNNAFKKGFQGIVLTGWQRYDHFAVLCELLPAALPSLAINLLAVTHGYFNSSLKMPILNALSCPMNTNKNTPFINLDIDPYLWDKFGRCMFPGSPFFRLTYRLNAVENEVTDYMKLTQKSKGWLTDYNIRRNYSLPLRVDELTNDLPRVYHGVISLARSTYDAMSNVFDNYTINEWIEQRIYPYVLELERLQNSSNILKSVNVWPVRPLEPLKDMQRLGVPPVN